MFDVWIMPHERSEAIEAYRDWLTDEQVKQIEDAPETNIIILRRNAKGTTLEDRED